jgi:hypothetical protein
VIQAVASTTSSDAPDSAPILASGFPRERFLPNHVINRPLDRLDGLVSRGSPAPAEAHAAPPAGRFPEAPSCSSTGFLLASHLDRHNFMERRTAAPV